MQEKAREKKKVPQQEQRRVQLVEIVGVKSSGKHGLLLHLATDLHQLHNYQPWRIESPQVTKLGECPGKRRQRILWHWQQQHNEIVGALRDPDVDVVLCKNYTATSLHLAQRIGLHHTEIEADHSGFPVPDIIVLLDHPGCEQDPEHGYLIQLCEQHGWFHGRTTGRHDTANLIDSIIQQVIQRRQVA